MPEKPPVCPVPGCTSPTHGVDPKPQRWNNVDVGRVRTRPIDPAPFCVNSRCVRPAEIRVAIASRNSDSVDIALCFSCADTLEKGTKRGWVR